MEEASDSLSFDPPPPEAPQGPAPEQPEQAGGNQEVVLEQASTIQPPTPMAGSTGLPSLPSLPSHPVLPLDEHELQEHRDAILQQQMLGRQLLNELTRRHYNKHHLPEEQ